MNHADFLTSAVKALIDKPDEAFVNEIKGAQSSLFEIRVAKEDVGKVIGKQGRIATSLRTIMSSIGMKERRLFEVVIIE